MVKALMGSTSNIRYILKKKKETSLEWLWQTNVASFSWYRPQSEANRKSSYYDGWKSIWGSVFGWRVTWVMSFSILYLMHAIACAHASTCRSYNNSRNMDNVWPKSKFVRPNRNHTGHSVRWEKLKTKLNAWPDYVSVWP